MSSQPYKRMLVQDSDLTAQARIRNAALEGFARDGVAGTSIRDVAEAADVSPGLVQHYFPSKTALRDAVNDYVIEIVRESFSDLPLDASSPDLFDELGDRITSVVAEHPTALLYVGRAAAEGDEAALQLFDAFVAIADQRLESLADKRLLHPDVDLRWAALHVVVMNLGTVLLAQAIDRHLPEPFFTPAELQRWNVASTALFKRAFVRPERAATKTPRPSATRTRPRTGR